MHPLIEKEKRATELMLQEKYAESASLWKEIIDECPNWEHGSAYYHLACCCEELNHFEDALRFYLEALKVEPGNPYYLSGYCSFLYLHGEPREALDAYLSYIAANGYRKSEIERSMPALKTLAAKLGLSDEELEKCLCEIR